MTKAIALQLPPDDERVLRAAARLFRRKGFAATTVREIAREARMLPGSLHYRYSSKEELLLALMERGVVVATEAVRAAVEPESDPLQKLRLGLRAHLRLLLSGDDAVFVLLYDWRSLEGDALKRMVRLRDRYEALWDGLLTEAVDTGRVRSALDVPLLRLFGFGAINWVATWYRSGGPRTPEQIADAFWTVIAFGLLDERERPPGIEGLFATSFCPPSPARTSKKATGTKKTTTKSNGGSHVRIPSPRA